MRIPIDTTVKEERRAKKHVHTVIRMKDGRVYVIKEEEGGYYVHVCTRR